VDFIIALHDSAFSIIQNTRDFVLTAVPVKGQDARNKLHGVTYQKAFIFISRQVSKYFKYLCIYPSPVFPVSNMSSVLREKFSFFNL
jgi:hypothetical protein